MWHRVGRDDFAKSLELRERSSTDRGYWQICSEYELCPPTDSLGDDLLSLVFTPKHPPSEESQWRAYRPLKDTPDLFLKFARLYRGGRARLVGSSEIESILQWVHKYGLLGCDESLYIGGPDETLGNYIGSVYWAAGILAMYEAALNSDEEAAKGAILEEFVMVDGIAWSKTGLSEREIAAEKKSEIEKRWDGDYLRFGLETAALLVQFTVQDGCRAVLSLPDKTSDPSSIRTGWVFKNLRGAMYLQMYWLMASGGDLSRCEYCGRIMSLARPSPDGRKRRNDKKFCDDACRQAAHRSKKSPNF